jgi:hypothetical protein
MATLPPFLNGIISIVHSQCTGTCGSDGKCNVAVEGFIKKCCFAPRYDSYDQYVSNAQTRATVPADQQTGEWFCWISLHKGFLKGHIGVPFGVGH